MSDASVVPIFVPGTTPLGRSNSGSSARCTKGLSRKGSNRSTDASDINIALKTIGDYVTLKKLPPKILLVHRFTGPMVTRYKQITLDPRVQLVIVMDGFGSPSLKAGSYKRHIRREPVQYAGFKLFYKNDKPLMTPKDVLGRLVPKPYVIIYQ